MVRIAVTRNFYLISAINLWMVGYLYVKQAGFHWWYFGVVGFIVLWIWIDIISTWGKEVNRNFGHSKQLKDVIERLDRIERQISK